MACLSSLSSHVYTIMHISLSVSYTISSNHTETRNLHPWPISTKIYVNLKGKEIKERKRIWGKCVQLSSIINQTHQKSRQFTSRNALLQHPKKSQSSSSNFTVSTNKRICLLFCAKCVGFFALCLGQNFFTEKTGKRTNKEPSLSLSCYSLSIFCCPIYL